MGKRVPADRRALSRFLVIASLQTQAIDGNAAAAK
jgi:hypothetical protein